MHTYKKIVRLDYLTGTLDWNTVTTFDFQITHLQLRFYAIKPTGITQKKKNLKYTIKQKYIGKEGRLIHILQCVFVLSCRR